MFKKVLMMIIVIGLLLVIFSGVNFDDSEKDFPEFENIPDASEVVNEEGSDLSDEEIVSGYVRENINQIAPEEAVLGGNFYVVQIEIFPSSKTGRVVYEDGHIQGSANFSYERVGNQVAVTNVSKIDI
ncbi:MAG: hypothetical protein R3B39_00975 [Candidatus Paceibacterota bacterium]